LKAATPEVGAAPSRAAGLDAATVPSAGKPPAAVAPAPIAAVPGALAPVGSAVAPVATGGVVPAKVTQAALAPAAAAAPVASPALAAHSKVSPPEADAAKVAAAVVGVPEIAKVPEEQPDQRLAIRGTVDPAAAGAEGIVFRIELSRPAEQAVVLIYGTVDGTAKAGQDYEPQQGIVTLTPGVRKADVLVPLIARPQSRNAVFELFLIADPKVADVIDQRIAATIPGAE
jgi:hypothetical protein